MKNLNGFKKKKILGKYLLSGESFVIYLQEIRNPLVILIEMSSTDRKYSQLLKSEMYLIQRNPLGSFIPQYILLTKTKPKTFAIVREIPQELEAPL